MAQICKINNIAVLNSEAIRWHYTRGTNPFTFVVFVPFDKAVQIFNSLTIDSDNGGGYGTLEVISDNRTPQRYERVYFVEYVPASDPIEVGMRFADVRWTWTYKHITFRANERRRTGNRHWVGNVGEMRDHDLSVEDFEYNKHTLDPQTSKAWQAPNLIKFLFKRLGQELIIQAPTFEQAAKAMPIENFLVADAGNIAINKVLALVPGVSVYIDDRARAVLTDNFDFGEEEVIAKMSSTTTGGGTVVKQNNQYVRPRHINVHFIREIEVRCNSTEGGVSNDDVFSMINVCQIPDVFLPYNADGFTFNAGSGTILPFDTPLYDAWNTTGKPSVLPNLPDISDATIRTRYWQNRLMQTYGLAAVDLAGRNTNDVDWRQRVGAIYRDYRLLWRLDERFVESTLSIKAQRVAMLSMESHTYGLSPWYADYCIQWSMRGMFANRGITGFNNIWNNVQSHDDKIENARRAPARVSVVDASIGLIRASYSHDPMRLVDNVIPGFVNNIPDAFVANENNRYDRSIPGDKGIFLKEEHKATTILTCVPSMPNSKVQYHLVKVDLNDTDAQFVGDTAVAAYGPPLNVVIPAPFTARFGWDDNYDEAYPLCFGLAKATRNKAVKAAASEGRGSITIAGVDEPVVIRNQEDLSRLMDDVIVNRDEVEAVAKAVANAVYARYSDRFQGVLTNDLRNDIRPRGNVSAVENVLFSEGQATTTIRIEPFRQPVNFLQFMPDNIRRVALRQVQI